MPWTPAVLLGHLLLERSHNSRKPSRPTDRPLAGVLANVPAEAQLSASSNHETSDDGFSLSLWSPADATGRRKRLSLLSPVQFADS